MAVVCCVCRVDNLCLWRYTSKNYGRDGIVRRATMQNKQGMYLQGVSQLVSKVRHPFLDIC